MRAHAGPVALAAATVVLVAGCSDAPTPPPARTRAPALGGTVPVRHHPPRTAMDSLEKPVADRLAAQIAPQGLTLEYLDCPHWDTTVPSRLTCRGYVDGIVASVQVHVSAGGGRTVDFDARLGDGVIATRRLQGTLRRQGWRAVDCGDVAAYPAHVGDRIVCRVERPGRRGYVVATIVDRAGKVSIAGY